MALVRAASSSGVRPLRKMAMRRAAVWASVMWWWVMALMVKSISSWERGRWLRFLRRICWMCIGVW